MTQLIINTVVTFLISGALGFCVSKLKNYKKEIERSKKNENLQNMALLTLLKGNLTSIFFRHSETRQIPDYAYQNFLDTLAVYESLGGNGFIHSIAKKMEDWEIIKTDIMK